MNCYDEVIKFNQVGTVTGTRTTIDPARVQAGAPTSPTGAARRLIRSSLISRLQPAPARSRPAHHAGANGWRNTTSSMRIEEEPGGRAIHAGRKAFVR